MGFLYTPLNTSNKQKLKNYQKKINTVYKRTESIRGFVINTSIELEWCLNNLIRIYYIKENVKDKRHIKFWVDILDHITLDRKIEIVKGIGIHTRKPFKNKYGNFIKKLREVQEIRNKMAHKAFSIGQNMHMYIMKDTAKKKKYTIINKKFKKKFKKDALELMDICSKFIDFTEKRDSTKKS